MRNRHLIFSIVLSTLLPAFAFAQDRSSQMEQCLADDAHIVIAGCTALIEAGEETERNLAVSYFHRGRAHFRLEDFERAIQDFDEAITLRPGFLNAFFQRGDVYLALDDFDNAIADFTEVVALNPEDAIAFRYRGNAHLGKMDYEAAVADFDEALRLNPDDSAAREARAAALAARG